MRIQHRLLILLTSLILCACQAQDIHSYSSSNDKKCNNTRFFTFSWPLNDSCLQPRGGTSKGTPVTLDSETHPGWLAIQKLGLSKFEQDRQAILAMAGPYRTSFDFLEIIGFSADYKPDPPYQSWGTEYVYVVEEQRDFISLQHIMVMFMSIDGEVVGPMVMKHWRQDWQYEKPNILTFQGERTWRVDNINTENVEGSWAQAVYQVDDSPRYESYGKWEHYKDYSVWESARTWRPLPRREFSVRDDYKVLEGYNKHTILRNGWVHEQENLKRVTSNTAEPATFLAKELGVNRYERIINHDFSAGDAYWNTTQAYWSVVRDTFANIIAKDGGIALKKSVDGTPLFAPLFDFADKLSKGEEYSEIKARQFVEDTVSKYLRDSESPGAG